MKNKASVMFFIKDDKDNVWGIAPSKLEAIKQINWFLPKENNYIIDKQIVIY
jgi:hypothetical protein